MKSCGHCYYCKEGRYFLCEDSKCRQHWLLSFSLTLSQIIHSEVRCHTSLWYVFSIVSIIYLETLLTALWMYRRNSCLLLQAAFPSVLQATRQFAFRGRCSRSWTRLSLASLAKQVLMLFKPDRASGRGCPRSHPSCEDPTQHECVWSPSVAFNRAVAYPTGRRCFGLWRRPCRSFVHGDSQGHGCSQRCVRDVSMKQ